jgi:hypothetical protein
VAPWYELARMATMPAIMHSPRRIFISYDNTFLSRRGWEVADRLRGELRAAGFEVSMDDELADPSRQYPRDAIREAVNRSDVMVAILGLSPSQPDLRREEHALAIDSGMPLLIVNTDALQPLPPHLSGRPWRRYPEELKSLLADLALDAPRVYRGPREPHYDSVPKLPSNHLIREKTLAALRDLVLEKGAGKAIAVHGTAGSGKTVLVSALCGDAAVRRAFPDGIGWITIGREWKGWPFTLMAEIATALGEDISGGHGRISNGYPRACDAGYLTLMREMAALIVVDDVWHLEQLSPLLVDSPRCRFLFTTRDPTIAGALTDRLCEVGPMSDNEARALLALWSGQAENDLPSEVARIVHACGGVPGSLAQIGACVRDGSQSRWQDAAHRIESGSPGGLDSVAMNVASLAPEMRERYLKLAVLLEDMVAPPVVLQMLWQVDAEEARRTAKGLVDRSLASREEPTGGIRLHDLQLDYARACYPDQKALELIHGALRLSADTLKERPEEFCSQMAGRLLPYQDIAAVAELIRGIEAGAPQPWLRPLWSTLRWPPSEVVRTLAIHCKGLLLTDDGRWVVGASADHTLKVWDLETGHVPSSAPGGRRTPFRRDQGSEWTLCDRCAGGSKAESMGSGDVGRVVHADGPLGIGDCGGNHG